MGFILLKEFKWTVQQRCNGKSFERAKKTSREDTRYFRPFPVHVSPGYCHGDYYGI